MSARSIPQNWQFNPSAISRRARLAALAAITAIFSPLTTSLLAAVISINAILLGICALIGSERRWAKTPWLVSLTSFFAATLFAMSILSLIDFAPNISPLVLAILAALQTGLAFDELLASAQYLRHQDESRRSLWRVYFGLSSRARKGQPMQVTEFIRETEERR
ncbi:MAG TPA: hypothetical protein VM432_14685 [Bdellovibrionales bacterium]|nr:hypothetical protein [Bdellovibrionales bacterium]